MREVEEVMADAKGLRRPITVGAGEVVIREFLIPKIGRPKNPEKQVRWVMRNLQRGKIQEGLASQWLDVGSASGLVVDGNVNVANLEGWEARTHKLPGLESYQREFQLGWNRKVAERRPEVQNLVNALRGVK